MSKMKVILRLRRFDNAVELTVFARGAELENATRELERFAERYEGEAATA